MTDQKTPAGWYPHPGMAGTLGYWDGERWTDQTAPMTQRQAAGPVNVPLLILGYVLAVFLPLGGLVVAAIIWGRAQTHAIAMVVLSIVSMLVYAQLVF